jgi:hypothetical protein
VDPLGLDPIDPETGKVNEVLRCHVNPHRDPVENAIGGLLIAAPLIMLSSSELSALIIELESGAALAADTALVKALASKYGDKFVVAMDMLRRRVANAGQRPRATDYITALEQWKDKLKDSAGTPNSCPADMNVVTKCHGY